MFKKINQILFIDATGIEIENGAIILSSEKYPPLIYDPFNTGTEWILSKHTKQIIDLESKWIAFWFFTFCFLN